MSTSDHPYNPLEDETASPTPGIGGRTASQGTSGTNGRSKPRLDRGGDQRGPQGCAPMLAQTDSDVCIARDELEMKRLHVAPNGGTSGRFHAPSGQKSPIRPQGTSKKSPIDRSACPGRDSAHTPTAVGTIGAYRKHGCRCPDVVALNARYEKRYNNGHRIQPRVPSIGAARRIQALSVLGWGPKELGDRSGVNYRSLRRIGHYPRISLQLHLKVEALYQNLSDIPAPDTPWNAIIRERALAAGWVPPIAWDEDTIDDPQATPQHNIEKYVPSVNEDIDIELLINGKFPPGSPNSRHRTRLNRPAVELMTRRGWSAPEIANRLGITTRTVTRIRAELSTGKATAA